MNYASITTYDINNGPGFRVSIWISGCPFCCPECHNQNLWDGSIGTDFNNIYDEIINIFSNNNFDGISILGGEPIKTNIEDIIDLSDFIIWFKTYYPTKTVWLYTGYVYENLTLMQQNILYDVDVLVDGLYVKELRDISLAFRGSKNQRLIDIPKTIQNKKVTLYEEGRI